MCQVQGKRVLYEMINSQQVSLNSLTVILPNQLCQPPVNLYSRIGPLELLV